MIKNEIIIAPDGCRTIIGPLAHKLAFERETCAFFPLTKNERFHVFEFYGEGGKGCRWMHRAGQSTRELAIEYMQRDRVLVEFQGDSLKVDFPFHNNEARHIKAEWKDEDPSKYSRKDGPKILTKGGRLLKSKRIPLL